MDTEQKEIKLRRYPAILSVTASALAAVLVASCSQPVVAPANLRTPAPVVSPSPSVAIEQTPAPIIEQEKSVPPHGPEGPWEAEFNGYAYTYKKDGLKTDAMFVKRPLPVDGNLVVGAIRDIIARSFGDKADSAPRLTGSGAGQTIKIDGQKHRYIVVPIKAETGEVSALIITQLTD